KHAPINPAGRVGEFAEYRAFWRIIHVDTYEWCVCMGRKMLRPPKQFRRMQRNNRKARLEPGAADQVISPVPERTEPSVKHLKSRRASVPVELTDQAYGTVK